MSPTDELVRRGRETLAVPLPPPERRREIRLAAGLSMSEIARSLGVSPSNVLNWERGARPGPAHRIAYSKLLADLNETA